EGFVLLGALGKEAPAHREEGARTGDRPRARMDARGVEAVAETEERLGFHAAGAPLPLRAPLAFAVGEAIAAHALEREQELGALEAVEGIDDAAERAELALEVEIRLGGGGGEGLVALGLEGVKDAGDPPEAMRAVEE